MNTIIELEIIKQLDNLIELMKEAKPDERSEKARIYAICITLLQQASGTFDKYVVRGK